MLRKFGYKKPKWGLREAWLNTATEEHGTEWKLMNLLTNYNLFYYYYYIKPFSSATSASCLNLPYTNSRFLRPEHQHLHRWSPNSGTFEISLNQHLQARWEPQHQTAHRKKSSVWLHCPQNNANEHKLFIVWHADWNTVFFLFCVIYLAQTAP